MTLLAAYDIDGTLLDYGHATPPRVNWTLLQQINARRIILVSNQGGLPLGMQGAVMKNGQPYATPDVFAERLAALTQALQASAIEVYKVRISVYHQRADRTMIEKAGRAVIAATGLRAPRLIIYNTPQSRKPSPWMLLDSGAVSYTGDSDEDEAAAAAAGIRFTRVERFL